MDAGYLPVISAKRANTTEGKRDGKKEEKKISLMASKSSTLKKGWRENEEAHQALWLEKERPGQSPPSHVGWHRKGEDPNPKNPKSGLKKGGEGSGKK